METLLTLVIGVVFLMAVIFLTGRYIILNKEPKVVVIRASVIKGIEVLCLFSENQYVENQQ